MKQNSSGRRFLKRYIFGSVFLLFLLFAAVMLLDASGGTETDPHELQLLNPYAWIGIITSLIIFCIKGATMVIPIVVLYMGIGAAFQPYTAVLVGFVGLILELSTGFIMGKKLGRKRVMPVVAKSRHGKKIASYAADRGVVSSFMARVVPGPPIDLISMLFGAVNARYLPFMCGSLLVLVPRMVLVVLLGSLAVRPLENRFLIPAIIVLVVIVVIVTLKKLYTPNSGPEILLYGKNEES
ncbi:sNARE-like domain protein [Chitinispirillum alkaliphilum]|nr:sNARE-like domain protein [Chitinispirillum alkaliphilum]